MDMNSIYFCSICKKFVETSVHCGRPAKFIINSSDKIRLSKLLSGILRHFPEKYGLKLDDQGFVDIDLLIERIRRENPSFNWIKRQHILAIVETSSKKRFEIKDNRIRAIYGHSIPVKIKYVEEKNVKYAYHGTSTLFLDKILSEGIKPMKRLYVHLTIDLDTALENARRKKGRPAILLVDLDRMRKMGYKIYRANEKILLTKYVPTNVIKIYKIYQP